MSKSTAEIRQIFLEFFHSKGHQVIASSSLIPDQDPSLLFINAGMNQFKNLFLGFDAPNYFRATTVQRCVRAGGKHNDLENVGYTSRHHTFFEMLGNFSFGDYFKYEAIQYAWELLTSKNLFNLSKERLWVTVYKNDDETYNIWKKDIGVPQERIVRIGNEKGDPYRSDNFWQMGEVGPCGPCTEIFYDCGSHIPGNPPGNKEKNNDRYIEIWNIVFMQFNRQSNGKVNLLPKPSVDTGMGLERIAAVLQNVSSTYEIDLFRTLIELTAEITGCINECNNKSLRVIADHIRSCAFLITDGVYPSNENRGYVLRRIIRRAVRHGIFLGIKKPFFYKLVQPLISTMPEISNELKRKQRYVEQVLKSEEKQFIHTLKRGLLLLEEELIKLKGNILDGKIAFRLYDTYGFPADLIDEVCQERNIKIDKTGFNDEMQKQRYRARQSTNFGIGHIKVPKKNNIVQLESYDHLELDSKLTSLFIDNKSVNSIREGQNAVVILDKTPFYAESGGQIGDIGELKVNDASFKVSDTKKYGQIIGHIGKLTSGSLRVGENLRAQVDEVHRSNVSLNHTATHLLHAALCKVLGTHIKQKGSLITDKKLRFDFSHFKAVTLPEIYAVENLVNEKIRNNLVVKSTIMDLDAVKEKGIIELFSGKYEKIIRLLSIGDFSIEPCIGTHTTRTGNIGLFHIISNSSIATGVRRIEAVTGEYAIAILQEINNSLYEINKLLKGDNHNLNEKVYKLIKQNQQLEKEFQQLKKQEALKESVNLFNQATEINGTKLIINKLAITVENKVLRAIVDNLKKNFGPIIIILAAVNNNKVFLIAGVSKDITDRITAKELISIISQQVNGRGGGNSYVAQAQGTNIKALPKALATIKNWITAKFL